jgi:hypothetical protein
MGLLFSSNKKVPTSVKFNFLTQSNADAKKTGNAGESKAEGQSQDSEQLLTEMQEYNGRGRELLKILENFPSTRKEQQHAMQHSKDETAQHAAFDAILPNALLVKKFFEYASEMEQKVPELVMYILSHGVTSHTHKQQEQWLEANEAVVHCLCDTLVFGLSFDNVKQRSPDVQNDFAYYRRNMGKFHDKAEVGEAETNTIAMWMADGTPMLTRLTDAIGNVYSATSTGADGVKHLFSNIVNVSCSMLMRGDVGKSSLTDPATENTNYCMGLMTAGIVVFDRVVPTGVFRKGSGVEMKKCVLQLRACKPASQTFLQNIRFSTKHFQDKDTPASLATLIEEARAVH